MKKSAQDKNVYTNGYVNLDINPDLIIYGSANEPFVIVESIPKWLNCPDKSYQEILESVDESNRMIKLIKGDNDE